MSGIRIQGVDCGIYNQMEEILMDDIQTCLKQKKPATNVFRTSIALLVPGTRLELVQRHAPRDFKSLASTNSATQAQVFRLF